LKNYRAIFYFKARVGENFRQEIYRKPSPSSSSFYTFENILF